MIFNGDSPDESAFHEQRERHTWPICPMYQKQDVQWRSDEEAAVKWILKMDPDFFSRNLPFMGTSSSCSKISCMVAGALNASR